MPSEFLPDYLMTRRLAYKRKLNHITVTELTGLLLDRLSRRRGTSGWHLHWVWTILWRDVWRKKTLLSIGSL